VASTPLKSVVETIGYWVELALLTLFGPAQLDDAHDPVVLLRRGHRDHHPNMHWAG
jgi:hypothetical protein